MLTIRQLAAQFGLSRATLLYYDRLGLLCPTHRSRAGYRLYDDAAVQRLAEVCRYRASGMPLLEIRGLVSEQEPRIRAALERRLSELNLEIIALRQQQQVVVELLARDGTAPSSRIMTQDKWVKLLDSIGVDREGRHQWHRAFERLAPEAHQDFLESLGISPEEIAEIRDWSRDSPPKNAKRSKRKR